jgi:hypothetical protein
MDNGNVMVDDKTNTYVGAIKHRKTPEDARRISDSQMAKVSKIKHKKKKKTIKNID